MRKIIPNPLAKLFREIHRTHFAQMGNDHERVSVFTTLLPEVREAIALNFSVAPGELQQQQHSGNVKSLADK